MATIYIIQGFIGAGKSTYSRKLAAETNAILLNADDFCLANYTYEERQNDWDACFSESVTKLWQEAELLLTNNKDVIWDLGFWSKASRDYAREKAIELKAELIHKYLYETDDVLIERIRDRAGAFAENHINNFYEIKKFFEEPTKDEEHILIKNGLYP